MRVSSQTTPTEPPRDTRPDGSYLSPFQNPFISPGGRGIPVSSPGQGPSPPKGRTADGPDGGRNPVNQEVGGVIVIEPPTGSAFLLCLRGDWRRGGYSIVPKRRRGFLARSGASFPGDSMRGIPGGTFRGKGPNRGSTRGRRGSTSPVVPRGSRGGPRGRPWERPARRDGS